MAVKIRMKKMGRRHRPFFRVCAMDSRSPRDGRVIEELGFYDPMIPETDARAVLDGERIEYWLNVGAQPTPKVAVLIKKYGKDGSHLNEQQQALNRLAARRGEAIATAAAQAAKVAESIQGEKAAKEAEAAKQAEQAQAAKQAKEAEAAKQAEQAQAASKATEAPAAQSDDSPTDDSPAEAEAGTQDAATGETAADTANEAGQTDEADESNQAS